MQPTDHSKYKRVREATVYVCGSLFALNLSEDNMKITKLNWPATEAQAHAVHHQDRGFSFYVSENHELVIEVNGDVCIEVNYGTTRGINITLPSDA